jgi:putative peptide zinc metalloprotease protein
MMSGGDSEDRSVYRLRPDLVFGEPDERGRTVVKDPLNRKMYGLDGATCDVLRQLDGHTPLHELPGRIDARHGRRLSPASLGGLIERAKSLGLLDGFAPPPAAPAGPAAGESRWRKVLAAVRRINPLYIQVRTFDPNPLLARFERAAFPLFTRTAGIVFAALVAFSLGLLVTQYRRYFGSFAIFVFFKQWLLAWILLTLAGLLHEIGHAVACRRFGGQVGDMGLLLYLFQPGLYTNVNDSWLFPRSQRIVVSLAGVYFEGFLWCLCVIIWSLASPFSATGQLTFVLSVVLLVRILLNLQPFLRLDGYFVLADLVGIQNLRPKALTFVVSLLPVLGAPWRSPRRVPLRERAILLTYGLLSLAAIAYTLFHTFKASYLRWHQSPVYWAAVAMIAPTIVVAAVKFLGKNRVVRGKGVAP